MAGAQAHPSHPGPGCFYAHLRIRRRRPTPVPGRRPAPGAPGTLSGGRSRRNQKVYIRPGAGGIQRTGGLVWIWQQPPKLQAGGSNPLLFAITFTQTSSWQNRDDSAKEKSSISMVCGFRMICCGFRIRDHTPSGWGRGTPKYSESPSQEVSSVAGPGSISAMSSTASRSSMVQ